MTSGMFDGDMWLFIVVLMFLGAIVGVGGYHLIEWLWSHISVRWT